MPQIYVDHAATAPMYPSVIKKMVEVMETTFGNPSSIHSHGREARHLIDEARATLAKSINSEEKEIVFTSGGTEANNLALLGAAQANLNNGRHIITTAIEHQSVLHVCEQLEKDGFEITYLPVNKKGLISIEELQRELRDETIIVSIMYGNNEVGTIQPIQQIGRLLKNHQALFHTDAVQAYGLEKIDVNDLHVDMLSVSAHKIGGPKGVGFLYVRDDTPFIPQQYGGEQERKFRPGTENVAAIVGFQEAVKMTEQLRVDTSKEYNEWKQLFIKLLEDEQVPFQVNSYLSANKCLPHILNIYFPDIEVETMLVNLDLENIAASSGSACTAGSITPSHVLVAMYGDSAPEVNSSIRFSFGTSNNEAEIKILASKVASVVKRLAK